MSKEKDPLKERLDALAKKTAKPSGAAASPKADPEERDQLIVLASRIQADAQALREVHKEEQARLRQALDGLSQSVKSQGTDFKQVLKSSLREVDHDHQKSLHHWADRLEELTATNRILFKLLLAFTGILFSLLAWELFA